MRMRPRGNSGFTLLELLVVVIIVGILATIAVPAFTKAMEKGRSAEAASILGAIKTAEEAYYQENLKYTASLGELAADTISDTSVKHYFKYTLASPTATTFTAIATRKLQSESGPGKGKEPGYSTAYTVTVDQDGNLKGGPP